MTGGFERRLHRGNPVGSEVIVIAEKNIQTRAGGRQHRAWLPAASRLDARWPQIALEAHQAPTGSGFLIPLPGKDFQQIHEP
jgi:hypothetical protein